MSNCPDCGTALATVDGPVFCPACMLGSLANGLFDGSSADGSVADNELLGGRYLLLEKVGEGGFAVVWRAQQIVPVEREVALKWLKVEVVSAQVLARFEGERSALARMQHPGVATVLDAGTHEGRPFFVTELVRGSSLTTA